ncbi:mediator of RNA polymerase II transcription subunit 10 [Tothia fuscella]|uniref:Mediator of RNA polymerase II transcription subunit 10 n=1 Tax=Tothia fuscella TaxID=1048955 RepID=A0A9P4NXI8_9PEZI|nr:mediator of RNA polymerase II transcription subunit 10 [Tothia fuscella]
MAPPDLGEIDEQIKHIVQNLYQLVVQTYEHKGIVTENAMKREIASLINNLVTLANTAPNLDIQIPPDVIDYVQDGRNPDIYTREFVEITMKHNQQLRGKAEAFAQFRDVLAKELVSAVPEMRDDVKKAVEKGGGKFVG